ncbi:MAG: hypothetical protein JWN34_2857 [Bryobacterales bacterium]|nr:hypothetical protein [Bryobacterales bacterium]
MLALRTQAPQFWQSLNEMWRARDPAALDPWATAHGVVDLWFQQVIADTVTAWEHDPEGPNAQLASNHPWYYLHLETDHPNFEPKLTKPYLTYEYDHPEIPREAIFKCSGETASEILKACRVETPEDLEVRLTAEFKAQLKEYVRKVRAMITHRNSPERYKHAQWTARVFTGSTPADIAKGLYEGYEEPEKAVAVAVRRFARSIGLTMPTQTRRPVGGKPA